MTKLSVGTVTTRTEQVGNGSRFVATVAADFFTAKDALEILVRKGVTGTPEHVQMTYTPSKGIFELSTQVLSAGQLSVPEAEARGFAEVLKTALVEAARRNDGVTTMFVGIPQFMLDGTVVGTTSFGNGPLEQMKVVSKDV